MASTLGRFLMERGRQLQPTRNNRPNRPVSLRQALRMLITGWALLGGGLLLLIVAATAINTMGFTANAIARSWGGNVSGLPGYEDGVTLLIGVAGLAMFPYAQLHKAHAAVDIFMQNAPAAFNRGISVTSNLLMAGIAFYMAVMLVYGTLETRADNVETTVLGWPVWIFMPTAVVSCVLWALAAVLNMTDPE